MTEHPLDCAICQKSFKWGHDEDSAIVDMKSYSENAYWKLVFHMREKHLDATMSCKHRGLGLINDNADFWYIRHGLRVCSYCGSLHPDDFMSAVKCGNRLTPTDKNYKAYIQIKNPVAGNECVISTSSGPVMNLYTKEFNIPDPTADEIAANRYERKTMGVEPEFTRVKFYYSHLTEEQMIDFIDYYSNNKMNVSNDFYVLPFFMGRN